MYVRMYVCVSACVRLCVSVCLSVCGMPIYIFNLHYIHIKSAKSNAVLTSAEGTINGYGERTGNANIISILPTCEHVFV